MLEDFVSTKLLILIKVAYTLKKGGGDCFSSALKQLRTVRDNSLAASGKHSDL